MPVTVTQVNSSDLICGEVTMVEDTILAAGALTYVKGTILGRITASGKLTHYASGAADGSQVPVAVLEADLTYTGAGDKRAMPIIGGKVRAEKLVIHGGGAITAALKDLLRSFTIISQPAAGLFKQES